MQSAFQRPLLLLESQESAVEQGKYGVVVVRDEYGRVQQSKANAVSLFCAPSTVECSRARQIRCGRVQ